MHGTDGQLSEGRGVGEPGERRRRDQPKIIHLDHRHRLQSGDGPREGVRGLGGGGQRGGNGKTCNSVNNKNKV